MTAIFKKGLRCEPGNYRPVSLTSQIGRLFKSYLCHIQVRGNFNGVIVI